MRSADISAEESWTSGSRRRPERIPGQDPRTGAVGGATAASPSGFLPPGIPPTSDQSRAVKGLPRGTRRTQGSRNSPTSSKTGPSGFGSPAPARARTPSQGITTGKTSGELCRREPHKMASAADGRTERCPLRPRGSVREDAGRGSCGAAGLFTFGLHSQRGPG